MASSGAARPDVHPSAVGPSVCLPGASVQEAIALHAGVPSILRGAIPAKGWPRPLSWALVGASVHRVRFLPAWASQEELRKRRTAKPRAA
eukprot:1952990-Alexandrium_andersonii.AAC.1